MTIRNFNSIYSSQNTENTLEPLNQVSTTKWDNRFDGLTLFNSQVKVAKRLTVAGSAEVSGNFDVTGQWSSFANLTTNADMLSKQNLTSWGSNKLCMIYQDLNQMNKVFGLTVDKYNDEKSLVVIRGSTTMHGTLNATGAATFDSTLAASGAVAFGSTLTVAGDTTLSGVLRGPVQFTIDPSAYGDETGTVTVRGNLVSNGTLAASGAVNFGSTLYGAGAATFGGTLAASGAVAFGSTLSVDGDTTLTGVLRGPAQFTIDPSAYGDETGTVTVRGNLISNGTLAATGAVAFGSTLTVAGITTLSGLLRGPEDFIIDPAAHGDETGTVTIRGNLVVKGLTTTINSETLDVKDLNLTLAKGSLTKNASDNAGLTIELGPTDGSAEFKYQSIDDNFRVNKLIRCASGPVVDHDLTNKAYVDARIVAAASTITPNSIGLNLISGFKFKVISNTVLFSSVSNDISTIENNILYIWNNGSTVTISLPVASGEPAESVQVYKGINMFAYSTISGEEGHWSSSA